MDRWPHVRLGLYLSVTEVWQIRLSGYPSSGSPHTPSFCSEKTAQLFLSSYSHLFNFVGTTRTPLVLPMTAYVDSTVSAASASLQTSRKRRFELNVSLAIFFVRPHLCVRMLFWYALSFWDSLFVKKSSCVTFDMYAPDTRLGFWK